MRPTTPTPARPRRLVLRPGVHVLRRSAGELQVGLDPRRAIVLPDSPGVRATLEMLASPASPPQEYDADALDLLADGDLVVDADLLLPLVPVGPTEDVPVRRADVAALASRDGDAAGEVLARRARGLTEVRPSGAAGAAALAVTVADLLRAAALPHLVAGQEPRGVRGRAARSAVPLVGLLVCVGEPPREELDGWVREGVPHLVLRLTEGQAVLGPFVVPGETACLRCVDAHHTDADPAWPLLVAQYASAVTRPREDAVPEPVDPVLATLAAAWAAREVLSHAEGRAPATASSTIRLDPGLTSLESHTWPRHPGCGCAWT